MLYRDKVMDFINNNIYEHTDMGRYLLPTPNLRRDIRGSKVPNMG